MNVTVMGALPKPTHGVRGIDRISMCHVSSQSAGTEVIVPWAGARIELVDLEIRGEVSMVEDGDEEV